MVCQWTRRPWYVYALCQALQFPRCLSSVSFAFSNSRILPVLPFLVFFSFLSVPRISSYLFTIPTSPRAFREIGLLEASQPTESNGEVLRLPYTAVIGGNVAEGVCVEFGIRVESGNLPF